MPSALPRRMARWLAIALAGLTTALLLIIFLTGDFGLGQRLLNGVEARAFAHRNTLADRLALRGLCRLMIWTGRIAYPRSAEYLDYYCSGRGDTLFFDAQPLLRHPEVQQALREGKQGIVFRHGPPSNPKFHVVSRTDWDLFYAFDVLYVRRRGRRVIFYDTYYFQPLKSRKRGDFRLGKIKLKLNDGLIDVAYPEARRYITYGEGRL